MQSQCAEVLDFALVREGGVEPPRAFAHWILSPARLPVSPLSRSPEYRLGSRFVTATVQFFRARSTRSKRDDVLRWYGVAMTFLHVVTYLFGRPSVAGTCTRGPGRSAGRSCPGARARVVAGRHPRCCCTLLRRGGRHRAPVHVPGGSSRWAYAGVVLVNGREARDHAARLWLRIFQRYMGLSRASRPRRAGKHDALHVLITLFYFWPAR